MSKKKSYTVSTPNRHFTGKRAGVQFEGGSADVKNKDKAEELVHGYGYACEQLAEQEKVEYPELDPDVPKREALIASGHTSDEAVKELNASALIDIDDIGDVSAERIMEFYEVSSDNDDGGDTPDTETAENEDSNQG